jgi:hypothetical protein
MRYRVLTAVLLTVSVRAEAQPSGIPDNRPIVLTGAGVVSMWDDETFLGRGPAIAAGIAQPIGKDLQVEGEFTWASHHRDAGYLVADGRLLSGAGRLVYLFRSPEARGRPFVGAGAAVVRSDGHFLTRNFGPPRLGAPTGSLAERAGWSLVRGALEVSTGVAIAASSKLTIRPEVRSTWTAAGKPGALVLQSPIWMFRFAVGVGWRI